MCAENCCYLGTVQYSELEPYGITVYIHVWICLKLIFHTMYKLHKFRFFVVFNRCILEIGGVFVKEMK